LPHRRARALSEGPELGAANLAKRGAAGSGAGATDSAVSTRKAGSEDFPRCGTGARKGVSVSMSIPSSGRPAAASRMLSAARKVIIPEKETR